jgi:hypothetical protein
MAAPELVRAPRVPGERDDLEPCDVFDEMQPVRADVRDGAEEVATRRLEVPVPVARKKERVSVVAVRVPDVPDRPG